jgi:hypothetical protein
VTLSVFDKAQLTAAKKFLAARVAYMMGRKLEEGDWAYVYCKAKGLPVPPWSNVHADIRIPGLALEQKMMR